MDSKKTLIEKYFSSSDGYGATEFQPFLHALCALVDNQPQLEVFEEKTRLSTKLVILYNETSLGEMGGKKLSRDIEQRLELNYRCEENSQERSGFGFTPETGSSRGAVSDMRALLPMALALHRDKDMQMASCFEEQVRAWDDGYGGSYIVDKYERESSDSVYKRLVIYMTTYFAPQCVYEKVLRVDKSRKLSEAVEISDSDDVPSVTRTPLVPVYRPGDTSELFATGIAPKKVKVGDVEVLTAPLAVGKRLNLLSISAGAADETSLTDSIAQEFGLKTIYLQLGKPPEIPLFFIPINVRFEPYSRGAPHPREDGRGLVLNFSTIVTLRAGMLNDQGVTVPAFDKLMGEAIYHIQVSLSGEVNLELGVVEVREVIDESPAAPPEVAELIKSAAVVGYDLDCYRVNKNRQSGILNAAPMVYTLGIEDHSRSGGEGFNADSARTE